MPLAAALLLATGSAAAQTAVQAPIGGEIERIAVNDPNDHWSGGTIQVGGQVVVIPRNLLIDLPANRVTLQQLFAEAPPTCLAAGETGLAKADACNASATGGFATIAANRTSNGNVIAGDVFIEKGVEAVTGVVTYIDYDDGYFRVNGDTANAQSTGVMVRLNDPDSRHTIQQGLGCAGGPNCSADPRFTLDPDNYTNVFSTGYPLCIPSTTARPFPGLPAIAGIPEIPAGTAQASADGSGDVLCPLTNRTVNNGQPVDDSRRMAPIRLGDSVTAEGNFETIGGARFLSAHTTVVSRALSTKNQPAQPDYLFMDEVEVDAPGFQNERARSLFIGFTTLASDTTIWSIHYDPGTNSPHEFPLASALGCDLAGGAGQCTQQGLGGGAANIFKIRHDVDFLAQPTQPRLDPCAHLRAAGFNVCPQGGSFAEQFAILSPIMHEIIVRTGHKLADATGQLLTLDINGNEATNGEYLFPFGMGLGGVSVPEFVEINLDAINTPFIFSGIPWNLDRRLSPNGCIDTTGDGVVDCEATPQPLDPFPYSGLDPRLQAGTPFTPYNDPAYTASPLTFARDRILSYVDPALGTFNGNSTVLAWPPADPPAIPIAPTVPVNLTCTDSGGGVFNVAPVATDVSDATLVSTPLTLNLAQIAATDANGLDPAPGGLVPSSVALVGTPADVVNNGDGTVTVTPTTAGVLSFQFTIADNGTPPLTSAPATVTVNVTASNEAPVANDDGGTTGLGNPVTIDVAANDTDANGVAPAPGGLVRSSVALVGVPAGVVSNGDGTVTVTPTAPGVLTFQYTISDNGSPALTSNAATVTVDVTAANEAPVAVNDAGSTSAGTPVTINLLVNDTDAQGNGTIDPASVTLVGAPAGVVSNGNGTVTVTPAAAGSVTFQYRVSDTGTPPLTSNLATVTVTVTDGLAITRSDFRTRRSEWRVDGTGTVDGAVITVRLDRTGEIIGSGAVVATAWTVRIRGAAIVANPGDTVTATSSLGGTATAVVNVTP